MPPMLSKKPLYSRSNSSNNFNENISNLSQHIFPHQQEQHHHQKTRCIHTIQEQDQTILSLATNDSYIFAGSQESKLFIWDLVTFQLVTVLDDHCGSVLNLTVHQDWLFSCSGDGTVRVWDIKSFKCVYVIHSYYDVGDIFSVLYTKVSNLLVIGCQNTSIQWYDFNDPQIMMLKEKTTCQQKTEFFKCHVDPLLLKKKKEEEAIECMIKPSNVYLNAHDGYVYCMYYTTDLPALEGREVLVTGSGDGLIKIWTIDDDKKIRHVQTLNSGESDSGILSLAISDDGYLFCGVQGGYVQIWDLETYQVIRSVIAHSDDVLSVSIYNSGFISASADGKIKFWDTCFDFIESLGDHQGNILAMTKSKEYLITGSSDQSIKIWDVPSASIISRQEPPFRRNSLEHTTTSETFLYALETLISIKTLSGQPRYLEESRRGAKFVKTILQQLGATSQLIPGARGRNPLVYGRFNSIQQNQTSPTVLFYGHYDVVATDHHGWLNDPFKMSGINGYLYGRGTSDNKGPLISNIFAVHELLKEGLLNVNVIFLVEGEEEKGSIGLLEALAMNEHLFQNIDLILLSNSYWLGEDVPCITYGLRGVIHATVKISNHLSDLHSGVEGGAVPEPLTELIHVLGKLVDPSHNVLIPDFYRNVLPVTDAEEILYDPIIEWMQSCKVMSESRSPHSCVTSSVLSGSNNNSSNASVDDVDDVETSSYCSIMGREQIKKELMSRWRYPTLTVHNIDVSVDNPTVISHTASATVSMRIVPNQTIDEICNGFKQYTFKLFEDLKSENHIEVDIHSSADYWLGDPHHPYFEAAANAIEEEWKMKPLFIREGGSIPAVGWLEKFCHAPAIHIPFGQSSDQAHLPNERIRLYNLHAGRRIIKSLLQKIGNKLKEE